MELKLGGGEVSIHVNHAHGVSTNFLFFGDYQKM